jgi:hypothetical protein
VSHMQLTSQFLHLPFFIVPTGRDS